MTVALDPLAPVLLPAAPGEMTHSTDAPSAGDLRPFGLTRTTAVAPERLVNLSGLTYDPVRQLNVTADAVPAVDLPTTPQMASHYDTQYDMQWVVDKD